MLHNQCRARRRLPDSWDPGADGIMVAGMTGPAIPAPVTPKAGSHTVPAQERGAGVVDV